MRRKHYIIIIIICHIDVYHLYIIGDTVDEYTIVDSAAITGTTALWCSYGDSDSAQFHLPNGSMIMEGPAGEGGFVYVEHQVGQVGLYKVQPLGPNQGVYTCSISHPNGSTTNLSVVIYNNSTLMSLSGNGTLQY